MVYREVQKAISWDKNSLFQWRQRKKFDSVVIVFTSTMGNLSTIFSVGFQIAAENTRPGICR